MKRTVAFTAVLWIVFFNGLFAQVKDSIKSYRLEDVTVQGVLILEPESFIKIEPKELKKADSGSLFNLGKKIPSIKVQTNSRGESLFFFRGSGERQITLFLDGVPLNIPWDNRIDLSLIPSGVIESITILKGVPPAIFGANAISGVINISSKDPRISDHNGELSIQIGETGNRNMVGTYLNSHENLSYLISAGYNNYDSYKLPSTFSDGSNPGSERINSFLESKSFWGKINYKLSDNFNSGLFISYINSEKGVPPEIGIQSPRYWKYPVWENILAGTSGNLMLDQNHSYLFYSLSFNRFTMQINQYTNSLYNTTDDIEKNFDNIFRSRLIYTLIINENSLVKIGLNGQTFQHKEEFLSGNFVSQTYSENILSGGVEYEYIKNNYVLSVGGGVDFVETPKTGDKPAKENVTDYAVNAAFVYSLNSNMSLRINGGRKTRFPTLRETFSGALGRFVPNPALKAESASTGEVSISYKTSKLSADASLFLTYLKDGIVRVSLPQRQFMRINKDEVRTFGFEFVSKYNYSNFQSIFNLTLLSAKGKNAIGEFSDTLEYRPELNGSIGLDYSLSNSINTLIELEYIGMEFGLKEGSSGYKKLPDYLLTNIRFAYSFILGFSKVEMYLRINNLWDRLYYTQFGLPEAGRQIFAGANFVF